MGMFNGDLVTRAGPALDQHLGGQDEMVKLLAAVLEALEVGAGQLAVTDETLDPLLLKDFPADGVSRWVIHRTANGGESTVKEAIGNVLPANVNRLGGSIVNKGAKGVVLFLDDANNAGAGDGQIFLAAEGGAWDFRLGNILWCGNISAKAIGGESTLVTVEV